MNWTGGALPRSRQGNAKAALTNAQKKHFAKVRGKLLGVPPSSPTFDTTIFKDASNRCRSSHHNRSPQAPHRNLHTQARLDDFKNTAPVVRKLESLRSRGEYSPSDIKETKVPLSFDARSQASKTRLPDREASLRSSETTIDHYPTLEVQRTHLDPPSSFEAKRQELLRRTDWVGLANTKPVEIQFPSAKDRELIGKRRRLDSLQHHPPQGQDNKRQRLAFHVHDNCRPPARYGQPSSSLGDISIRIGEQEYEEYSQPGGSINVAKQDGFGGTSDEMLLDRELFVGSMHSQDMKRTAKRYAAIAESSSVSARRPQAHRGATPASLQTSWAGFSPWTESEGMTHQNQESESVIPIKSAHTVPLAESLPCLADQTWAGVPGLPLVFSNSSQAPIEISSASVSEIGSDYNPSERKVSKEAYPTEPDHHALAGEPNRDFWEHSAFVHNGTAERREHKPFVLERKPYQSIQLDKPLAQEAHQQATTPEYEQEPLGVPVRTYTPDIPESAKSSIGLFVPDSNQNTDAAEKHGIPAIVEAPLEATALPLASPRSPNPVDEELVWRKFVFGSKDVELDWTLEKLEDRTMNLPETAPKSTQKSPSAATHTSPNQSSLLAEASSSSNPTTTAPYHSSTSDHLSFFIEPATSQRSPLFDTTTTSSSHPQHSSFPSNPLELPSSTQSPSKNSLRVQASPSRARHTLPSLSSDELAATPARPTFVFRKPARYVGREGDGLGKIHLGLARKGKVRGRGRGMVGEVEVWDDGEGIEGMVKEDEIEDDLA